MINDITARCCIKRYGTLKYFDDTNSIHSVTDRRDKIDAANGTQTVTTFGTEMTLGTETTPTNDVSPVRTFTCDEGIDSNFDSTSCCTLLADAMMKRNSEGKLYASECADAMKASTAKERCRDETVR